MGSGYRHLEWSFQNNPALLSIVLARYQKSPHYLTLLDDLILFLRKHNVKGIQEKIDDVGPNNLSKFRSAISEFKVAKSLALNRKRVTLLTDNYLAGKSPDILAQDHIGEHYIEVARFSDDETIDLLHHKVTELMKDQTPAYRVDILLPSKLSMPAVGHEERRKKDIFAEDILSKFAKATRYEEFPKLPFALTIEGVTFEFSQSPQKEGFVGIISTEGIVLPSSLFSSRIRFLVSDASYGKALKREKWLSADRSKYYVIAIDVEQPFFDLDHAVDALFGTRTHYSYVAPKVPIRDEVKYASSRGWDSFLTYWHFLPKNKTVFDKYGAFLEDSICKNVSGVLVLAENKQLFLPNPFAFEEICNPKLIDFVPRSP